MNEMMKNSAQLEGYLDKNGVAYLWDQIKTYVGENAGGGIPTVSGVTFKTEADIEDKVDFVTETGFPISIAFVLFYDCSISGQNNESAELNGPCYVFYHFISNAVGAEYKFYMMNGDIVCMSASNGQIESLSTSKWATEKYVDAAIAGLGGSGTVDWSDIQNKPDLTALYRFKGSVSDYASLPTENLAVGDVYDVSDTGMNYGWTGEAWDPLGQTFNVRAITNEEIDAIISGSAG